MTLPVALHPSTVAAVCELRERFPNTPFLTLGQTTLWDEPVKAAFGAIAAQLESENLIAPGTRIVAGVHDTDYFAKLEGLSIRDTPFVTLRHNDGDTRGLWSAAGELSALFGAEIVPSRADFTREGVAFARAARVYPGGAEALLNQETDAPLWRAVVHTEPHHLIAAEVRLRDIEPALREQLRWGFRHSLQAMGCGEDFETDEPCQSREIARRIWGWNDEFLALHPDATLSDLYRDLIPKIWALVGGNADRAPETTSSLELFRFNAQTANLPRFGFVDAFLNPATREVCKRAYDDAVRGSGIYTLDGFGPGALPFDVVIPGHGRGTLRLHDGKVIVETETPIEICENCDPDSISRLAAILQGHFGSEICLVGKAVALISMLSAEFLFVFHEKASSYTTRTQKMNAQIRAAGVTLPLHPMLRLQYSTWDALQGVEAKFQLPPYMERAFRQKNITARDFAARWWDVAKRGDETRAALKNCRSPHDLMRYLAQIDPLWREKETAYVEAGAKLRQIAGQGAEIEAEIAHLRARARESTDLALQIERQKGEAFRAEIAPLRARISDLSEAAALRLIPADENGKPKRLSKEERAAQNALEQLEASEIIELRAEIALRSEKRVAIDAQIASHRARAREALVQARDKIAARVRLQKGEAALAAREKRERLAGEAELGRLRLVRDAIWASEALRLTNYRPTAWWLPMVSPDGTWFRALVQTAQARCEEL